MKTENLVAGAIEGLLVGVLEGEGGGGAVLPAVNIVDKRELRGW